MNRGTPTVAFQDSPVDRSRTAGSRNPRDLFILRTEVRPSEQGH